MAGTVLLFVVDSVAVSEMLTVIAVVSCDFQVHSSQANPDDGE